MTKFGVIGGPLPCNGYEASLSWDGTNLSPDPQTLTNSVTISIEDSCVRGIGMSAMEYIRVSFPSIETQPGHFMASFSFYVHHEAPEADWFVWPAFKPAH